MQRTFEAQLKSKDLNKLVKQLQRYKTQTLPSNIEKFLKALADVGISIAKAEAQGEEHKFYESGMIVFEKKIEGQTTIRVIGRNDDLSGLHSLWWDGDGNPHETTISPILAIEYGTAGKALAGWQGTMSIRGHETDTMWHWYADAELTDSRVGTAVTAKQPMYKAMQEMCAQIENIARYVFK